MLSDCSIETLPAEYVCHDNILSYLCKMLQICIIQSKCHANCNIVVYCIIVHCKKEEKVMQGVGTYLFLILFLGRRHPSYIQKKGLSPRIHVIIFVQ